MDEITKNTNNNEEGGEEEISLPPLAPTSPKNVEPSSNIQKKPDEKKKETVSTNLAADLSAQTPDVKPTLPEKPKPIASVSPQVTPKQESSTLTPTPISTTKPALSGTLKPVVPTTPQVTPKPVVSTPILKPTTPVIKVPQETPAPVSASTTTKTVSPTPQPVAKAKPPVATNTESLQNEINKITPQPTPATQAPKPDASVSIPKTVVPTPSASISIPKPLPQTPPSLNQVTPTTSAINQTIPKIEAKVTPTVVATNQGAPIKPIVPTAVQTPTTPAPVTPNVEPQPKPSPTPVLHSLSPKDLIRNAKNRLSRNTAPTTPVVPQQIQQPQTPTGVQQPIVETPQPVSTTVATPKVATPTPGAPLISTTEPKLSEIGAKPPIMKTGSMPTPAPSIAQAQPKAPILPNLRTLKGDISDIMRTKKTSLISMAAAEQKKHADTPKVKPKEAGSGKMKKMLIALGSGVLILAGISFGVFTFISRAPATGVLVERDVPSLIFVDSTQALDISNKSRREIMNGLTFLKDDVNIQLGLLEQIVPIFRDEFETIEIIDTKTFLTAIDARVPDSLIRSFDPFFTLGVHSFSGNQPFIIFKVRNFRAAFADILEWEETMSDDLAPLFGLPLPTFIGKVENDDVVETPTPPENVDKTIIEIPLIPQKRVFEDVVIKNQDVRVLRNDGGDIVLLYTFPNEETTIITTNENTLNEILTRLGSTRIF